MANHIEHVAAVKNSKKLAKAGVIATGSHLGTKLIHAVARRPLLVFGIGLAVGVIWHQKRQQQAAEPECCSEEE